MSSKTTEIRRVKVKMLLLLVFIFTVITTLAVIMAALNLKLSTSAVYLYSNFVVLGLTYLLFAIVLTYLALYRYETRMDKLADTDRLTNGINYEKFLREADLLLEDKSKKYAVFYADIMNFKYINDTFGYDVGDNILMFISSKIKETVGEKGYFARISADNYTAIVPYEDKNEFVEYIYSIIDDVCWFEDIQKAHYKPEIYVGIFCTGETNVELTISEMIDRANMAQKSIKGSSEYHIAYYTEEIRERVIAEKELERRMESALANEEFKVYFQPKYEVDSGEIVGAEALVRWDSPESGFMSPAKFIPLFEQNGFIINLDQFVFETVCKNMRDWIDAGIKVVPVSINVSRLQFYRLDFVKRYTKIKEKYDIPDGLLELEFTESIVFENLEILKKIVMSLKKVGFSCSIDDFGSGYSSLNILKNLPMDTLKLDRLFFKDSENLDRDKALISSVVTMSRALSMKTVAEGIENWAQVSFLKEIGCDIIQGYVYSEPIPHSRFTTLLEGNRRKEMPAEFQVGRNLNVEDDPEFAIEKLKAIQRLLPGMLLEVDFNNDTYKFINIKASKDFVQSKLVAAQGEKFSEILKFIIDRYVHPDDAAIVKNRCSPISVMSSFYQNERTIVTEMRVLMNDTKTYEWSKISIVRINPDSDSNDFRAFVYAETSGNKPEYDQTEKKVLISESVRSALMNVCSFIYELDIEKGTFKKLYCNTQKLGNQPDSGDVAWAIGIYAPKFIVKEDMERFSKFCNLKNVENAFNNGKEQLLSSFKIRIGSELMNLKLIFSKMKVEKNGKEEYKCVLIGQSEDVNKQYEEAYKALETTINDTVVNFCDIIFYVDATENKYSVYQTKPPFLNIPNNQSYEMAVKQFVNNVSHPDDCEEAEKFLSLESIKERIANNEKGSSIKIRCRTKDREHFTTMTIVSMCSMKEDKPYATFFVQDTAGH